MRPFFIFAALACFAVFVSLNTNQSGGDDILGTWLIESGEAKVLFYKTNTRYFGKIVWLKEPNDKNGKPKKDIRNKDERLRDRTFMDLILVRDMEYNTETKVWHKGKIYKPGFGQEADCVITLVDSQTIRVKGSLGLLSETQTWKRSKL